MCESPSLFSLQLIFLVRRPSPRALGYHMPHLHLPASESGMWGLCSTEVLKSGILTVSRFGVMPWEVIPVLSAGAPRLSSFHVPRDDPWSHPENGRGVLPYAANTQQLSATNPTSTAKHPISHGLLSRGGQHVLWGCHPSSGWEVVNSELGNKWARPPDRTCSGSSPGGFNTSLEFAPTRIPRIPLFTSEALLLHFVLWGCLSLSAAIPTALISSALQEVDFKQDSRNALFSLPKLAI